MANRRSTRNLFPHLRDLRLHSDSMQYVEERLIEEAEAGTLFLTDICNPPNGPGGRGRGHWFASLILNEADCENGRLQYSQGSMHPSLRDYMVRIRAITKSDGSQGKIGYKTGHKKVVNTRIVGGNTTSGENQYRSDEHEMTTTYPAGEDAKEATLPIRVAWQMLCQRGKNAGSSNRHEWSVEEVHPSEVKEEAKRKGKN